MSLFLAVPQLESLGVSSMGTSPISMLTGGVVALILGVLFRFRVLPFLKPDMMLSGGKEVSTAHFSAWTSKVFFISGIVCILASLIWMTVRRIKR